jgi:Flp pilus assembly protein TadG
MSQDGDQSIFNKAFRAFCADRRGVTAMTFALASVPIIVSVGAAIDYSMATRMKAKLDTAADAAALAVISQAAMASPAGSEQQEAKKIFKAQASLQSGSLDKPTTKVKDSNSAHTATITYSASILTTFMGIIGYSTITIGGSSSATSAVPTYLDFYLLLDNTPSMGVGATPTDVAKMLANTPDKCAFACHDLSAAPNDPRRDDAH